MTKSTDNRVIQYFLIVIAILLVIFIGMLALITPTPTARITPPTVTVLPTATTGVITLAAVQPPASPTETPAQPTATNTPIPPDVQSISDLNDQAAIIATLERRVLSAENLTTSEDDNILVAIVQSNPSAVGFFGHAYYTQNQGTLRAVRVKASTGVAVEPNRENIVNGYYPLTRPLFLYSSPELIRTRPEVEAFLGCYLNQIFHEIEEVGYFPPSNGMYQVSLYSFDLSCQNCEKTTGTQANFPTVPACHAANAPANSIAIAGSSTVYPITQQIAELFQQQGFTGEVKVDSIGTGAGFERFCIDGDQAIVNASRPIKESERQSCQLIGRSPIVFPIGLDSLTVVVSQQNNFVDELSLEQLRLLFTDARTWMDVNPSWPGEPIVRAIPGEASGTFDFFVEKLAEIGLSTSAPVEVAQTVPNPPTPTSEPPTPTSEPPTPTSEPPTPTSEPLTPTSEPPTPTQPPPPATPTEPAFDYVFGYLSSQNECKIASEVVRAAMERSHQLRIGLRAFGRADQLYAAVAHQGNSNDWVDFTLCNRMPDDGQLMSRYGSFVVVVGSGYALAETKRWYVLAYSGISFKFRDKYPCAYQLLQTQLDFANMQFSEADAAAWIANHADLFQSWLTCAKE